MCLLVIACGMHPTFDLVVAGNRDERHSRPTAALDWWIDAPDVLAGRDLEAGGTWLGVQRDGRFGAVTNFREGPGRRPDAPSRGGLVADFLCGTLSPADYLDTLASRAARYAGFNLLLADRESLWYASNRSVQFARPLPPGLYGLSNDLLDTPWPKLVLSRERLGAWVDRGSAQSAPLFELLADRQLAPWGPAEPTAELERRATAPFIVHPEYGTRCSTLVLRSAAQIHIAEQRFAAEGRPAGGSALTLPLALMELQRGVEVW